jgi:hypothetical protein
VQFFSVFFVVLQTKLKTFQFPGCMFPSTHSACLKMDNFVLRSQSSQKSERITLHTVQMISSCVKNVKCSMCSFVLLISLGGITT